LRHIMSRFTLYCISIKMILGKTSFFANTVYNKYAGFNVAFVQALSEPILSAPLSY
jgi:hypothetical protein